MKLSNIILLVGLTIAPIIMVVGIRIEHTKNDTKVEEKFDIQKN